MGALHAGHVSLVEAAVAEGCCTVASIFVNPAQFGPNEDFDRYPRTLDADLDTLGRAGAHLVFAPPVEEIYPRGRAAHPDDTLRISVGRLGEVLEGKSRPGFFDGVALVVGKLLNSVQPDVLFLGQKDFQQTVVLRRLVSEGLWPVEVRVCPTVRDADGLALSSRNRYLNPTERAAAAALYQALQHVATALRTRTQPITQVLAEAQDWLRAQSPVIRLDYLDVVDPTTLDSLADTPFRTPAAVVVAAWVGTTRLIDNIMLD
jgi:pantoate--beta-alanine ligase